MYRLIFGCGYLGSRVAAHWQGAGGRVAAVTRSARRAGELVRLGIEPVVADVNDPASLRILARFLPADTILYCVGRDKHGASSPMPSLLGNVLDALAELAAACRKFLYVGSTSVYGHSDGSWVDESAACPIDESGRTALADESRLLSSALAGAAIVLRLAGIYGPGRLPGADKLRAGIPLEAGPERWLNLIHVDDGAAAVCAAELRGEAGQIYNVADGNPVRRGDYFHYLARQLNAPPPRFHVPAADRPQANRRIDARKLSSVLAVSLRYPSYRTGIDAALSQPPSGA